METEKKGNTQNSSLYRRFFLVLVPHRDIRAKLKEYINLPNKNCHAGIYSFPLAAPLACLSKPFNTDELKNFAHSLRKAAGENKFNVNEISACAFPAGEQEITLYGQELELNNKDAIFFPSSKIKYFFSKTILGAYLIPKTNKQQVCSGMCARGSNSQTSFRAAAIANMSFKPVKLDGEIAYMWKIGKLIWLPKKG